MNNTNMDDIPSTMEEIIRQSERYSLGGWFSNLPDKPSPPDTCTESNIKPTASN